MSLWNIIVDYGKQIIGIRGDVDRNTEVSAVLKEDVKEIYRRLDRIVDTLQTLTSDLERLKESSVRDRTDEARERENQLLKLQIELLKFERRLPRGDDKDEEESRDE